VKDLAGLLAAALNEKVTVTENGRRRQVTKREAVIAQLVNKSASAELRAGHQDADRDAPGDPNVRLIRRRPKKPFCPGRQEVVHQLIARLRRNMCHGCPRREAQPSPRRAERGST
jgi:hypothetical protein